MIRQRIDSIRRAPSAMARPGAIWRDMPVNQGKDSKFTVFYTARNDALWSRQFPDLARCPESAKWANADIDQIAVANCDFMSTP
jgi:hypothetical protein